ncbi:hypothetical protein IW262DRAFT_552968 [Armillaria fumosa]|nr:hypothetical protein IW262DRAFT_552968 [Armillaria fumosa]
MINGKESSIAKAIANVEFWKWKRQDNNTASRRVRFRRRIHGIGVNAHVHRITNHLGCINLQPKPRGDAVIFPHLFPEYERQVICTLNLQSWLPAELHPEINHLLLVGFGQVVCLPVRPQNVEGARLVRRVHVPVRKIPRLKSRRKQPNLSLRCH